jgi:hypothetical protein
VVNGSFGDRFVEGIYLHADHATPTIRMYDFGSQSEISVQDFKSYPDEFSFRDPSCLVRSSQNLAKDMLKIHAEDLADDALIAEELGHQAVTRSQTRAMERAEQTPFVAPAIDSTPPPQKSPSLEAGVVDSVPPLAMSVDVSPLAGCQDRALRYIPEIEFAREFVKLSYPVTLPLSCSPPDLPLPKGEMVVVATRAQKQFSSKAIVWVKFLLPPSHVGKQMQLYPKSLEPKNGPAKGQDFSLLTALEFSHPGAKTWKDVSTASTSLATAGSWPLYTVTMEVPDSALRQSLLPAWKPRSLIQPFCTNSLMRIFRRAHRRATPVVCKILSTATRCSVVPSNILGSWLKRPKWTESLPSKVLG